MKKDSFSKNKIVRALFNFEYAPYTSIERKLDEFEEHFTKLFDEGGRFTKVPDESPLNIPRFVLTSRNNRRLEVSVTNAILMTTPKDMPLEDFKQYYTKKSSLIFDFLSSNPDFSYEHFRTLVQVQYPLTNKDQKIDSDMFQQYFTFTEPEDLDGLSLQINKLQGDFKSTHQISRYDTRVGEFAITGDTLKIKVGDKEFAKIETSRFPVTEQGIQTQITVETTPDVSVNSDNAKKLFDNIIVNTFDSIEYAENLIFGD